jgi:hypothetical protein
MAYTTQSFLFRLKAYVFPKLYKCSIIVQSIIKDKIAQIVIINTKLLKKWQISVNL